MSTKVEQKDKKQLIIPIVCFVLALIVLIMCIMAGKRINEGAVALANIETFSMSSFFDEPSTNQELAIIYSGFGMAVEAMGVFFASILTIMGLKSFKKKF